MAEEILACTECGGTNVEVAMWVNPNTDEIGEEFGSGTTADTQWCHDCEDHVLLEAQ